MKKNIAFYINNSTMKNVDLSDPTKGNPGIGATQYLMVLIASKLQEKYQKEFNIHLFVLEEGIFPANIKFFKVEDELSAISLCKKHDIDLLITRTTINKNFYKKVDYEKQKVITWSHNRIWLDHVNMIAQSKYVIANVCVGEKQREELKNHSIYDKTVTIFNPSISDNSNNRKPVTELHNTVTYVGSITKERGLHVLLSIWKNVKKEVPDAKLNIIGGANLYDRSLKTGDLGLSNKKYETKLKKFIFKDSIRDESITFHGILGSEKQLLFNETKVGIINPYGYETLGLSGIEMAKEGIPLVTIKKYGQSEIVKNNETGYLFTNKKQFGNYIITLLKNDELNNLFSKQSKEFISNKFSLDSILNDWLNLIRSSLEGKVYTSSKKNRLKLIFSLFYLKSIMRKLIIRK